MHIEARLFEFVAAFFILVAVLYGTLTTRSPPVVWSGRAPRRWR